MNRIEETRHIWQHQQQLNKRNPAVAFLPQAHEWIDLAARGSVTECRFSISSFYGSTRPKPSAAAFAAILDELALLLQRQGYTAIVEHATDDGAVSTLLVSGWADEPGDQPSTTTD